jgi:hypothetical protein
MMGKKKGMARMAGYKKGTKGATRMYKKGTMSAKMKAQQAKMKEKVQRHYERPNR